MREWYKIIARSGRTIALALVFYFGFFFVLTKISFKGLPLIYYTANYYVWKGGQAFQLFTDFEEEGKENEVLVLGSSHAYRGYDPRVFAAEDLRLFNLGTSGQPITHTNIVLQEYFHPQIKTVLIDVYAGTFTGTGLESSMDLITNMSSDKGALQIAWQQGDFRALNALILRTFQAQKKPHYTPKDYVLRGFCSSTKTISQTHQPDSTGAPKLDFSKKHLQAFAELLSFLRSEKVNVALISHPLPKRAKTKLRHLAFLDFIQPVVEQYQVTHFDFTLDHDLDTYTHFSDWNHLNQVGVERYNQKLIAALQEQAIF